MFEGELLNLLVRETQNIKESRDPKSSGQVSQSSTLFYDTTNVQSKASSPKHS